GRRARRPGRALRPRRRRSEPLALPAPDDREHVAALRLERDEGDLVRTVDVLERLLGDALHARVDGQPDVVTGCDVETREHAALARALVVLDPAQPGGTAQDRVARAFDPAAAEPSERPVVRGEHPTRVAAQRLLELTGQRIVRGEERPAAARGEHAVHLLAHRLRSVTRPERCHAPDPRLEAAEILVPVEAAAAAPHRRAQQETGMVLL